MGRCGRQAGNQFLISLVAAYGIFESFIRFAADLFNVGLAALGKFRMMIWIPCARRELKSLKLLVAPK